MWILAVPGRYQLRLFITASLSTCSQFQHYVGNVFPADTHLICQKMKYYPTG